jgi:hypothetical protein
MKDTICINHNNISYNTVTGWVYHATNNFMWVSDLANLYWTLTLTHLTIITTCSITWLLAQYSNATSELSLAVAGSQLSRLSVSNWLFYIGVMPVTQGSGLNGSKHYTRVQSPVKFPPESGFDLLLFPSIWTVPHFQKRVSYLYVMILPCILVTKQQHILGCFCVYL